MGHLRKTKTSRRVKRTKTDKRNNTQKRRRNQTFRKIDVYIEEATVLVTALVSAIAKKKCTIMRRS